MQVKQKNICPLKRRVKIGICEIDQPCNGTLVEYGSDTGFEFRYAGVWYEAKNGKVNPL